MTVMNDFNLNSLPEKVVNAYLAFPQRNHFLPVSLENGVLNVMLLTPEAIIQADHLVWKLGLNIRTSIADEEVFYPALEQALSLWEEESDSHSHEDDQNIDSQGADRDLLGWSYEDAPIVRLVNKSLHQAISQGVSDIHFENHDRHFAIRFRMDGELHTVRKLDTRVQPTVLARIKVMGKMDVAETRAPQDGRFDVLVGNKRIDLRVSTMPTLNGEKAVLRVLDRTKNILSLSQLGLQSTDVESLRSIMSSPFGIILVTGPTGSGKTTTLYAALSEVINDKINIMTVEDPVEYHLTGVNQVQVNRAAGVSFAKAVRGFLRQDPDIILVGEIRDHETASTAVQASLTGHLVLTTLHTNDAPTAITRLLEMGIEPFLLASSMIMAVGQRLVRLNCLHCSVETSINTATRSILERQNIHMATQVVGQGCARCRQTGFQGRQGVFEIMPVTENLRGMMIKKCTVEEIRAEIRSSGHAGMLEHGLQVVSQGKTTIEEVLRVTRF